MSTEAKALKETLDKHVNKGVESTTNLVDLEKQNKELQEEIRQTLGDANRVGMAASFKERKNELKLQQLLWSIVFIASTIAIAIASWRWILPSVLESREWHIILGKIATISPLIWLGWFAAKQYSYTIRIREDYAFKYASSMAYEGHKKATREVDPDLERVLLEFSLFNMSQNPIRLYSKTQDHATPVHEFTNLILEKLPNLKKVAYEPPGLGKFVAELGPKVSEEDVDE